MGFTITSYIVRKPLRTYLFLVMALAFGPQLASGFSGNLASLSDRDFGLAPGMTVKSACVLKKKIIKKFVISLPAFFGTFPVM